MGQLTAISIGLLLVTLALAGCSSERQLLPTWPSEGASGAAALDASLTRDQDSGCVLARPMTGEAPLLLLWPSGEGWRWLPVEDAVVGPTGRFSIGDPATFGGAGISMAEALRLTDDISAACRSVTRNVWLVGTAAPVGQIES
jgi:hypothetical protein